MDWDNRPNLGDSDPDLPRVNVRSTGGGWVGIEGIDAALARERERAQRLSQREEEKGSR